VTRERSAKPMRTPKSSVRHLNASSPRALSKVLADHLKALNLRDLDRLMTFYADDAVLIFPASPPVEGKANIRRAYASFFENWEETSTYGVVIMSGTTVAVEGTVTGRHRTLHLRIPGRIPTSSRPYRHNFAMFVEVEGGKIRRQRVYFDARDLVKQLLGDV
jgi:steroid delta-isomerase-like uncharacterized protein